MRAPLFDAGQLKFLAAILAVTASAAVQAHEWGGRGGPVPPPRPPASPFVHPGQPQFMQPAPAMPPTFQQYGPNYAMPERPPWTVPPNPPSGWQSPVMPPPAIIYSEPSLRERRLLEEELQLRRWYQQQGRQQRHRGQGDDGWHSSHEGDGQGRWGGGYGGR